MMRGNITRPDKASWRLKFDARATDGERQTRYVTVASGKTVAQAKLAELLASVGKGTYVEPSKLTVGAFTHSNP